MRLSDERLKSRGSRGGLSITQDESAISRAFRGYPWFWVDLEFSTGQQAD